MPLELDKEKESKPEENIAEKVNLRSQQDDDKLPTTPPIPELESEDSVAQKRNQQGQGLKILAPNQLLSRWTISLAQLNTGNNVFFVQIKKNLQKRSRKVWLTLFKIWKQFLWTAKIEKNEWIS